MVKYALKLWRVRRKALTGMATSASFLMAASGVTAIEFAIIFPVLLLLFMGVIEFSLIIYASSVLDGATVAAARAGRTGFPVGGTAEERSAYVRGILNDRIGGLLDKNHVLLASRSTAGFASVSSLAPCAVSSPCPEDLGGARYEVVYTSSYPWQILTPGLAQIAGDASGIYYISATAVVKNEPFNLQNPTPAPTPRATPAPTTTTTPAPTTTPEPTAAPTEFPTNPPSFIPTDAPTSGPTEEPTTAPTPEPTEAPPTPEPTEAPTPEPTAPPPPTDAPTAAPTDAPTNAPTSSPTAPPQTVPPTAPPQTAAPTSAPTPSPTFGGGGPR